MAQQQLQGTTTPSETKQGMLNFIHVRGDSDSDLDNLFKAGLEKREQNSWLTKKLPPSFWVPPNVHRERVGNHSREGSTDSTGFVTPTLQPLHSRSHSSPAQLPNTLCVLPQPQHSKQTSVDGFALNNNNNDLMTGWDNKLAQQYLIKHLEQQQISSQIQQQWPTTTAQQQHNQQQLAQQQLAQQQLTQQQLTQQQQQLEQQQFTQQQQQSQKIASLVRSQPSSTPPPVAPSFALQGGLGPLPAGWEQAVTPQGEVYFINHVDKTTSWYDPRIAKQYQRPGMTLPQLTQLQLQMGSSMQLSRPAVVHTQPQVSPATSQHLGSPAGTHSPSRRATPSPLPDVQQQLQRIQLEKEALIKKQQDLARQEMLLQHFMGQDPGDSRPELNSGVMDPFLGQSLADSHARQNSGDSGLGGMGTSYSLPRTPEGFLNNVDDIDSNDIKMHGDFSLDSLPGSSMDLGDAGAVSMESDDLVPSLQEDIGSELLNDVDLQKIDNTLLTWL